jgi:hypothetical protein
MDTESVSGLGSENREFSWYSNVDNIFKRGKKNQSWYVKANSVPKNVQWLEEDLKSGDGLTCIA